jgi:hypothetical protein
MNVRIVCEICVYRSAVPSMAVVQTVELAYI